MKGQRSSRARRRIGTGDVLTCLAGTTILIASFVAQGRPLLLLLGFLILTQLLLRILVAASPMLAEFFLGWKGQASTLPRMERDVLQSATATLAALTGEGRYADALVFLTDLSTHYAQGEFLVLTRAWCHAQLNQPERAARLMEACCREKPQEPVYHYALACYRSMASQIPSALDALSVALELAPELREVVIEEPALLAIRGEDDFARLVSPPTPPT